MSDPGETLLEEKRTTYHRFMRLTLWTVILIVVVLALMAATLV